LQLDEYRSTLRKYFGIAQVGRSAHGADTFFAAERVRQNLTRIFFVEFEPQIQIAPRSHSR
jgi:hypothetical protein